jgi:aspartyl/asparaginyl beta-hydroxylase (cupin superfamily)
MTILRSNLPSIAKANAFWTTLRTFALIKGIGADKLRRVRELIYSNATTETPRTQGWQHFPGLTATPWHDPGAFPRIQTLVDNATEIKDEMMRLQEQGRFQSRPPQRVVKGQWQACFLRYLGRPMVENCLFCPATVEMLNRLDYVTSYGLIYFSALEAGSQLNLHYSHSNVVLRVEIVLATPPGSTIEVAGSVRQLIPGECLMFDESFGCKYNNDGDSAHLGLAFDIWHPELSHEEIMALNWFSKFSINARRRSRAAAHAAVTGQPF